MADIIRNKENYVNEIICVVQKWCSLPVFIIPVLFRCLVFQNFLVKGGVMRAG